MISAHEMSATQLFAASQAIDPCDGIFVFRIGFGGDLEELAQRAVFDGFHIDGRVCDFFSWISAQTMTPRETQPTDSGTETSLGFLRGYKANALHQIAIIRSSVHDNRMCPRRGGFTVHIIGDGATEADEFGAGVTGKNHPAVQPRPECLSTKPRLRNEPRPY